MGDRRPSLRHGLSFGWWKSADFWVAGLCLLILSGLGTVLFAAWWW